MIIENPGSIRTGKYQMLRGGVSDCRNKALMKMFNLLDFGERAGSGVPNILQTWDAQGWKTPEVEELYGPDRTRLTLTLADTEGHNVPQDVPQSVPHDLFRKRIVEIILTNPTITQDELAKEYGVSSRPIKRCRKWTTFPMWAEAQTDIGKSLMKTKYQTRQSRR